MSEPTWVKVGGGKAVKFASCLDAVTHLLAVHCTPADVQALRGDLGRRILNTFEVQTHDISTCPDDRPKPKRVGHTPHHIGTVFPADGAAGSASAAG